MITEHCAEFFNAGFYLFVIAINGNKRLVALEVRGNCTCACVRLIAQDTVADVVVVRNLNTVKEDRVLKLC